MEALPGVCHSKWHCHFAVKIWRVRILFWSIDSVCTDKEAASLGLLYCAQVVLDCLFIVFQLLIAHYCPPYHFPCRQCLDDLLLLVRVACRGESTTKEEASSCYISWAFKSYCCWSCALVNVTDDRGCVLLLLIVEHWKIIKLCSCVQFIWVSLLLNGRVRADTICSGSTWTFVPEHRTYTLIKCSFVDPEKILIRLCAHKLFG